MFYTRVLQFYKFCKYPVCNVTCFRKISIVNNNLKMSSEILCPPTSVRGQTVLQKELFKKNVKVPCVIVKSSSENISQIIKNLKKYLLKLEHFKPVITTKTEDVYETLLYLCPNKVKAWEDISENERDILKKNNVNEENLNLDKEVVLQYENYSLSDILKCILPPDEEGMASYTKVGHIVHLNLREHLLPFKKIIGEVLLEKVHGCKTVVNKINIIDNTYRNFQMELLSGEDNMMAKLKENKCLFEFNFSTVYWNSRLSSEHERIVNLIKENDVLFDIFAGVGPFSIPAAKKKCITYANDLNPESFNWLNHNKKINKIDEKFLKTFNKDGREFILNEVKDYLIKYCNSHRIHITMNLPAMAVEFLPCFYKLYSKNELRELNFTPVVYLYCFTKGEDSIKLAKEQVFEHMGFDISDKIIDIFKVRTVSNFKEMMRVTIKLDMDILVGSETKESLSVKRKAGCDIENGEPWEKIRSCTKLSK